MDDLRTLVIRARGGDVEAFDDLVRLFQDMSRRYAAELLGDDHLAEDAAQEALVACYRELPSLREPAAFRNWLRRLVHKHCDRIRRRPGERAIGAGHELALLAEDPLPDERLEAADLRARVMAAVADLPEHEGVVTRLFYWDGLSHAQAGAVLRVPAHTVKSRLYSARRRLEETLMAKRKTATEPESHPLDAVLRLSDREVKLLLFNLPYTVLARAFMGASSELVDKLVRNLTTRGSLPVWDHRTDTMIVGRSWEHTGITAAQERVLSRADTLGRDGRINWPPPDTVRTTTARPPSKRYQRLRAGLEERLATPLHVLSFDEITRLLVDLSTVATAEGWMVLEPPKGPREDSFVREGVWMIIDGAEPDLVLDLLETWRDTLLRHHELAMDMIVAGLLAVAAGDNPAMVLFREQAWFRTELVEGVDDSVDIDDLKKGLLQTPHARLSLDERAVFMAQLTAIARREGIRELGKLLGHLGDDYLEMGLKLLVEGTEPQVAMEVLETRKQTAMDQLRTRYRMVIEGLLQIQAEERTQLVEAKVRSLY